jgi:hypothetical protein
MTTYVWPPGDKAAGEVAWQRLTAENKRLREELENMLVHGGCNPGTPCVDCQSARAALGLVANLPRGS